MIYLFPDDTTQLSAPDVADDLDIFVFFYLAQLVLCDATL